MASKKEYVRKAKTSKKQTKEVKVKHVMQTGYCIQDMKSVVLSAKSGSLTVYPTMKDCLGAKRDFYSARKICIAKYNTKHVISRKEVNTKEKWVSMQVTRIMKVEEIGFETIAKMFDKESGSKYKCWLQNERGAVGMITKKYERAFNLGVNGLAADLSCFGGVAVNWGMYGQAYSKSKRGVALSLTGGSEAKGEFGTAVSIKGTDAECGAGGVAVVIDTMVRPENGYPEEDKIASGNGKAIYSGPLTDNPDMIGSVVVAIGSFPKVRGEIGDTLILIERIAGKTTPVVSTLVIDGELIRAGVVYTSKNGKAMAVNGRGQEVGRGDVIE